jgi:hypothetical protein
VALDLWDWSRGYEHPPPGSTPGCRANRRRASQAATWDGRSSGPWRRPARVPEADLAAGGQRTDEVEGHDGAGHDLGQPGRQTPLEGRASPGASGVGPSGAPGAAPRERRPPPPPPGRRRAGAAEGQGRRDALGDRDRPAASRRSTSSTQGRAATRSPAARRRPWLAARVDRRRRARPRRSGRRRPPPRRRRRAAGTAGRSGSRRPPRRPPTSTRRWRRRRPCPRWTSMRRARMRGSMGAGAGVPVVGHGGRGRTLEVRSRGSSSGPAWSRIADPAPPRP